MTETTMMDAQAIDAQAVAQALDKVSFEGWIGAAVTLLLGIVAIRILMHLAARALERLPLDRALSGFLQSAAQIVLYIVLGTMVAGQLGVPVTSLVALLSLFALAISLSIQNVLANVVSGMVILTAKPFAAGDYIELKTRFDTAYQEQSSRLNQLSVELARLNRMLSDENKWLVNIRNIRKARKLTPEIAQAMIDHINVYKTGYAQHRLEIIFRFQEERDALEAAYHELEGGEAR